MTGSTVDRLYVHAKIGVVDDGWLTIGSANLNAHSFFNDTEVNVHVSDAALARGTRLRLWSEHLDLPEDEIAGDPTDVIDRLWIPIARRERERQRTGQRREHACASSGQAPARSSVCSDLWTPSSSTAEGAVERRRP
jgi:phosphatidylserine/phosphatidylglycerophosphate/cardiolipin synthase-like enzyme